MTDHSVSDQVLMELGELKGKMELVIGGVTRLEHTGQLRMQELETKVRLLEDMRLRVMTFATVLGPATAIAMHFVWPIIDSLKVKWT